MKYSEFYEKYKFFINCNTEKILLHFLNELLTENKNYFNEQSFNNYLNVLFLVSEAHKIDFYQFNEDFADGNMFAENKIQIIDNKIQLINAVSWVLLIDYIEFIYSNIYCNMPLSELEYLFKVVEKYQNYFRFEFKHEKLIKDLDLLQLKLKIVN